MGSSDVTSRLVAQTTEDTGLVPAGVTAARPGPGEGLPGGAADPLEEPEQATTAIVPTVTMAAAAARLCLRSISPQGPRAASAPIGIAAGRPPSSRHARPGRNYLLDLLRSCGESMRRAASHGGGMTDTDVRQRAGRPGRTAGTAYDLIAAKLLRP